MGAVTVAAPRLSVSNSNLSDYDGVWHVTTTAYIYMSKRRACGGASTWHLLQLLFSANLRLQHAPPLRLHTCNCAVELGLCQGKERLANEYDEHT
jgi:hypothetical protein